jgi:decaprenyl-phosphate phosphoribosyltransferase
MRPRQWPKNLLIVIAPLASGRLLDPVVLWRTAAAVGLFAVVSSAMYLINDVVDRERDAAHDVKRDRPVASGRLPVRVALAASAALVAFGLAGSVALGPPQFVIVVATYMTATTIYSTRLKNEPVYDIVLIASGFLLRAIAGGVVVDIPLSSWFLVTSTFGALFVAAGKRASELSNRAFDPAVTRPSLAAASHTYLTAVWIITATVTITATALWALEVAVTSARPGLAQASAAPLSLAILRYALWIDRGLAEAPEAVLLRDPSLVVLGAIWAILMFASTGALS